MSTLAFDQPRRRRRAALARPALSRPRRSSRTDRPAGDRGRAEPVGARPQRLGERLLLRRRALDDDVVARVPLRRVRRRRAADGGQAAAGAVGAGAVGAGVRVHVVVDAGAAGADGRSRPSGSSTTWRCGASGAPRGSRPGLTLALTPITVAISRHNNPDALLVLCITAAVWALDRGLRTRRQRDAG